MKNMLKSVQSIKTGITIKLLITALLSIQLFACSSTQIKKDINENNWQVIGQQHGREGVKEYSLSKLKKLSNKYGSGQVDYPTYQKSYEDGLSIYCQPENAIKLGASGKSYNGVCERFPHGYQFWRDWSLTTEMKSAM